MGSLIASVGKAMYNFADVGGSSTTTEKTVGELVNDSGVEVEPTTRANRNSLSHLCRRFLMMLLVANETVR